MDETTKAMIKDMLNRGMDNDTIMGVTGATQDQIDQVATEGKSSFLDNLGIFSTAQASEIDPNNPPSMLPTGAMDRETPFGDMLKPEVPRGGSIFSGRQFDQIRGGPESGAFGVRGLPQVQDLPVDFSELDDLEAQDAEAAALLELAQQEERRSALETLKAFGKDIAGRSIASQALGGAGGMIFGIPGALAGLTFGALKGGDLFNRNPVIADIAQAGNPFGLNMRRDAARISNMLQRGAAGKNFSQKNLDNLLGKFGITGIDTGGMMDSIAESAQTGYGGYGSSDAAAAAAASGGRDYSSSPGAMAGDMEYGEE